MKTALILSALAIVVGYAVVELAKTSGLPVPAILNAGNAFIAFATVSLALLTVADYGRKPRLVRTTVAVPTAPPLRVRATVPRRRPGYLIRRGDEAARLASAPAPVMLFPKKTAAVRTRAA